MLLHKRVLITRNSIYCCKSYILLTIRENSTDSINLLKEFLQYYAGCGRHSGLYVSSTEDMFELQSSQEDLKQSTYSTCTKIFFIA